MLERVVLFVEDNPDDRDLALRALHRRRLASQIVIARNGAEALDYLFATGAHAARDARQQPQLVLLDLKLPKLDGLEVLKRIRADERTRRLPVVVLTSSDDDHDVGASYDLGASSYVRKPVDSPSFGAAMEQLGLYWLVLNQPVRSAMAV
jgi:two-component system response regulator